MDENDTDDPATWAETAREDPDALVGSLDRIIDRFDAGSAEERNQATIAVLRLARARPDECVDAIPALAEQVGDSNATVQHNAALGIKALAKEHPESCETAITALVRGLVADEEDLRSQCESTLSTLEETAEGEIRDAVAGTVADAADRLDAEDPVMVNDALVELLRLARTYPEALRGEVMPVVDHLDAESNVHRYHAALILRRVVAEAPELGSDAIGQLIACLDDPDADVRDASADALNEIVAQRPAALADEVHELVSALQMTGGETLATVIHQLAEFDAEHVGSVLDVDTDGDLARAVHETIEAVRGEEEPNSSSTSVPDWLVDLADDHDPERVRERREELVETLEADDSHQRNLAAQALSGAADITAEAVRPILSSVVDRLADEDDTTVRYNLTLTVRRVVESDPEAAQTALPTLVDLVADETDPDVRRAAALALSDFADDAPKTLAEWSFSRLAAGLRADEAQIRKYTAWTLGGAAAVAPEAVAETAPELADLLDDPDEDTQDRATRALVQLARQEPQSVRDTAPILAERLGVEEGPNDLCGGVAYETLRGDADGTAGDRKPGTCEFLYFGSEDMWGCPHEPESDRHCVFHQPVAETDDEVVREEFVEAVTDEGKRTKEFFGATFGNLDMSHTIVDAGDNYPIQLKGAVFKGRVDWSEVTIDHELYVEDTRFKAPVDCSQGVFKRRFSSQRSTFEAEVDFSRATFGESGHFDGTTFESDASFGQAQFALDAGFKDATVVGEADFFGASVGQFAKFDNFRVEEEASFRSVSFEGPQAVFTGSDFEEEATFHKATFDGSAKFSNAAFGSVSFLRTTFNDLAVLRELSVSGDLDATSARFADNLYAKETMVGGTLDFSAADVAGMAMLVNLECGGDAVFWRATFDDKVNLQAATVKGDLEFERATVHDGAVMTRAAIEGAIALDDARFAGRCVLTRATVDGDVSVEETTIDGRLSFGYAAVSGTMTIENAEVGGETHFHAANLEETVDITNTVFEGPATFVRTTFTAEATLDGSTFRSDTDFSSAEVNEASFSDCTFAATAMFPSVEAEALSLAGAKVAEDLDLKDAEVAAPLDLSGAAVDGCCDISRAALPSGGEFRDATIGTLDAKSTVAGDDLAFVGATIEKGFFGEIDLPPSEGRVDLAEGKLQNGRIALGADPAVFDFTGGTIGDVRVESSEDCFDYLRLVETSFEGFDFSQHKDELEAANWKLHELVEVAAPVGLDFDTETISDRIDTLTSASERLAAVKRERREVESGNDITEGATDRRATVESIIEDLESVMNHTERDLGDVSAHGLRGDNLTPGRLENTYLKAKNGANDIGDNRAAAEFFLREMRYRREKYTRLLRANPLSRSTPRLAWKWLGNSLLNVSCGYGERPFRTVIASGMITVAFALLYWSFDLELPYSGTIGYLTFSLESFVSLLVGKPQTPDTVVSFFVALEGFLGGFIIALFVFALTRSINR